MKAVIVEIDSFMFGIVMRGRRDASITSDWPADAKIVGGQWNIDRGRLRLLVESVSFDEVLEGYTYPDWSPTITTHLTEPPAAALIDLIEKFRQEA